MDREKIEEIGSRFGRQHMVAAGVACVVSLLIHAAVGVMAARMQFLGFSGAGDRPRIPRKYEAIHMADAVPGADLQERVLDELLKATGVDEAGLSREVDELTVSPDEGLTEPLPTADEHFLGGDENIAEPSALPSREVWCAKQEVIAIEERVVAVEPPGLERRVVPTVERVGEAPDVAVPKSRDLVDMFSSPEGSVFSTGAPDRARIERSVVGGETFATSGKSGAEAIAGSVAPSAERELFEETPAEVTDLKPIERVLTAGIQTFSGIRDLRYGYFKITIRRAGAELLPVIPKDVLLVQDCSASISEQRLYFCRQGLVRCLALVGPKDRFNVARFKEGTEKCFPDWHAKTPVALKKAETFIDNMQSGGNTDLCRSMVELLSVKRAPGRPVVAIVITDGLANMGLTDSSDIIGAFSSQNNGAISVYTMGTVKLANTYLLDLLSYCNKGTVDIVTKGRWDIPDASVRIMQSVSRPVLANLRFRFANDEEREVYPVQTANLYLDHSLDLYGRYRKGTDKVVFHAVGEAGDLKCDLLFDLPIDEHTKSKDKTIRSMWARQKIYHLIGEYARTGDDATYSKLRKTSRAYGEKIPYRKRLRR